jgi:HlyD family secretion protein
MKNSLKFLIFIGVIAAVAGAIFFSRQRSLRDVVEVEAELLEHRNLSAVVEASGQIEPAVSVDISSDVIGRIIALGAEEGDQVKKGQFLIQVDPTQFEMRVAQLDAALDAARSSLLEVEASMGAADEDLKIRQSNFDRDLALYEDKLLAASLYETTEAALRQAEAQVNLTRARIASAGNRIRQAEASRNEAADQLAKCRISSPMDGVVIRKNAEVGETAISGTLNNQGSLLMTIADLSVMETEIDVDETDVIHLEMGQEVEVSLDAFPSRKFRGEVTRIGNSAIQVNAAPGQRQSADYKVEVTLLESDSKIRPGLSATARITTASREQALSVPIQSLVLRERPEADEEVTDTGEEANSGGGAGVAMAASRTLEEGEDEAAAGSQDSGVENAAAERQDGGTDEAGAGDEVTTVASEDDDAGDEEEIEGVFVVRDGKAVFVPVTTGIAGEKYFEVLDGLSEGDQVVTGNFAALRKLKDGDVVKLEKKDKDNKDS